MKLLRLNEKESGFRIVIFIICIGVDAFEVYNGLLFCIEDEK